MKYGNLSGTPEEIKDFFENNGFKAKEFLEPFRKPSLKWIIIPASLVIVDSFLLKFGGRFPPTMVWLLIVTDLLFSLWLTSSIQLRFKNLAVTLICAFVFLMIFGYSANIIKLDEAFKILQKGIEGK